MATYRYELSHLTPDLARGLNALPGLTIRDRIVNAPDNAAWLVEKLARVAGVRFSVLPLKEDAAPFPDEAALMQTLLQNGARDWVPGFLAPYQRDAILAFAHRSGHLWHAAGSGKTVTSICWALASPGATVMVTRAGVRRSHKREIERFTAHRAYVIEGTEDAAGLLDSDALFAVVGWQNLPDSIETLLAWRPKNVIFDECFPGDTLVSTPTGPRRIDAILPGDIVLSLDAHGQICEREVTRALVKPLRGELVEVTHEGGSFVCTPNHKVWTEEDGYVEAGQLAEHHHLRVVWGGTGTSPGAKVQPAALLRALVQRQVADGAVVGEGSMPQGREGHGGSSAESSVADAGVSGAEPGAHDGDESDAGPGDTGEGFRGTPGASVSGAAGRERSRIDAPAGEYCDRVSIAGRGVFSRSTYIGTNGNWRSSVLTRLGGPGEEARGGSGREVSQDEDREGAGRPEGFDSRVVGVVSVARVERERAGRLGSNLGAHRIVFDLEVADTHRYFANGTLVSNCHTAKSNKRWSATPTEDGRVKFDALANIAQAAYRLSRATKRRLGATATPIKDRTRDLWAQLDLVHPDEWGRFYSRDRASFTGRYCAAHPGMYGGVETGGSSNLDELWQRVSIVVHQVPHSETHRHLPPRRRLVTYVTQSEQCAATGFTKTFFKQAAKGGQTGILEARLMEAAAKKRKLLLELVEEAVSEKQKIVIFTGRREDCDKLAEDVRKLNTGARVFSGHGGVTPKARDAIQQDYMASGGPCVLVATGDSFGEGVNLQDTDLLLIAMLPYTPGQVVQWEGRVARHGQKRPVLIQYLIAENTVDEHVAGILLDKLPAIEGVSRDDSLDGFSDALMGADDIDNIVASVVAKLGDMS